MTDWLDISFDDHTCVVRTSESEDTDDNSNEPGPSFQNATKDRQTEVFQCKSCTYSSRSRGNLYRHTQSIHNEKRFKCETCSKAFSQRYDLNQHIKIKHKGIFLMCEVCSKTFNNRYSLRRHRVMTHTSEAKHKCVLCNARFYEKETYFGHLNKHVDAKPYSCRNCNNSFAYKNCKERHFISCQRRENTKTCNICQKNFKTLHSLKAHTKGVHGNKDKRCPCGKTFSWAYSYTRHQKTCKRIK